jgi:putative ABC transport system permease protein
MFKHIFKIALRNYIRNKSFAFINVFGLSFGLTTFILITLFVQYEFSFDKFHEKHDRIYALQLIAHITSGDEYWQQLGYPISNSLREKFPEIEKSVVTRPVWGEYLSSSEKLTFFEEKGQYAEQSFFDIFTTEFLEGTAENALFEPYSIVLTESLRKKYFLDEPALGKSVRANNRYDLKVTGVINDFPKNSSFEVDYLAPIKLIEINDDWLLDDQWENFTYFIYTLLYDQVNPNEFQAKIRNFLNDTEHFKDNPTKYSLWLNPLKNWHLLDDPSEKGLLIIVYLYSGVAFFALMIACVNFMNLTTAYSVSRAREIGVKKVLGSGRKALTLQFIFESVFVSLVSMLILFITLLTGLISGLFPAFFLSKFKPVQALKNSSAMSNTKSPIRRILVTFQFILSSVMILSTLVIYKQFIFMKNKELGFDKELVLHAAIGAEKKEDSRKLEIIKSRLHQIPEIRSVAVSNTIPFFGSQGTNISWEGAQPDEILNSRYNFISYDFLQTFGIDLVKGRNFSKNINSDIEEACLINETAVLSFGWDNPIDKKVNFWGKDYRVVGVVKDFHPFSVFDKIPPFVFRLHNEDIDQWTRHAIRIAQGTDIIEIKQTITDIYKDFFPNTLFDFQYLGENQDDVAMEIYQGIVRTFLFFSIITIAIAAVGMFGLVAYTTKARTKEIGVRKVHGASTIQIFILLAKEFIFIIIIAIILSLPAGIGFKSIDPAAYKPENEMWEYLFTGLLVITVTFVTISFHTRKASRKNPTEALRYE